ncbi:MAG: FecR family protein, partial [Anaerolineales bacterium]
MLRRLTLSTLTIAALVLAACGGAATTGAPTGSGAGAATTAPGSATSTAVTRTAKISELKNDVDARDQKEAQWADAAEGQPLNAGGGTKTGADSRVRIDTSEGSIVRIGASTEFELLEFSAQETDPITRIQLDSGKLWVQVTKALGAGTFEVETPAGVATVRGSLMSVEFDRVSGRLAVTCLEGECELRDRAQGTVRLLAGEASEIASLGTGPLAARRMTRVEVRDWIDNFPEAAEIARALLARLAEDETAAPPAGGVGQT